MNLLACIIITITLAIWVGALWVAQCDRKDDEGRDL
jgi:hypothetical protein